MAGEQALVRYLIQQRTRIRPNRCFEQMLQSTNLSFFPLRSAYLFFTLFYIFCVLRRRHLLNSDFEMQESSNSALFAYLIFQSVTGLDLWLFWESLTQCIFLLRFYLFFYLLVIPLKILWLVLICLSMPFKKSLLNRNHAVFFRTRILFLKMTFYIYVKLKSLYFSSTFVHCLFFRF